MATTSTRQIVNTFAGLINAEYTNTSAQNALSPGQRDIRTLAIGDTVITPPAGGSSPKGVTIIPPVGNTEPILLKGDAGDVGVELHPTDPTSLGLNNPTTPFTLTVTAQILGVAFIWS